MSHAKLDGKELDDVPLELDPMHIGDVNHHYPTKKAGTLAKVGLAAALIAAGGGLGVAAPFVLDMISQPDVSDSDTQYGLDITVGD